MCRLNNSDFVKVPFGVLHEGSKQANDTQLSQRLWEYTEKLIADKIGEAALPQLP
jgi:cupin superfamily acireductone dioxygenase involved in methionine salvage